MEEMPSFWGYDEEMEQQLGQKLLYTTLELEKLKEEAVGEMSKNKEQIKQLILLLKYAVQERDEARNQLHKLPNAAAPPSVITECNSPSDAYNTVDSLFDCMASPAGMPGVNLLQDPDALFSNNQPNSRFPFPSFDQGSLIIDSIVRGRVLPEKGKFLEAVKTAAPTLETLLKPGLGLGPLPRWRNPPQIQHLQIPQVPITPCHRIAAFSQKPSMIVGHMAPKSFNLQPYGQTSCGTAQVQASPLLNFSTFGGAGGCLNNFSVMSSGMNCSGYGSLAKRPRFI